MKRQVIRGEQDLATLEDLIVRAAGSTTKDIRRLVDSGRDLDVMAVLKFTSFGCDPLVPDRELNLVEQLNQTFTYLASVYATRWLLRRHAGEAPFVMNLGTRSGADIESENGRVSAETFAATHPRSNDKLRKDIQKVASTNAEFKYVFFLSPEKAPATEHLGVEVIHLTHPVIDQL